jgi:hypothetical protein
MRDSARRRHLRGGLWECDLGGQKRGCTTSRIGVRRAERSQRAVGGHVRGCEAPLRQRPRLVRTPGVDVHLRKHPKRQRQREAVCPQRLQHRNALLERNNRVNGALFEQQLVAVPTPIAQRTDKLQPVVPQNNRLCTARRFREVHPGVQLHMDAPVSQRAPR